MNITKHISRRQLLKGGLVMLAGLAVPMPGFCRYEQISSAEKAISLHNLHTGEEVRNYTYWASGKFVPDALEQFNWLLRDHRTNQVHPIDPDLFDLVHAINARLDNTKPVQIISGYRSPETNRALRTASGGVAKRSLHMEGRALDIRLSGCDLKYLRKAAKSLQVGGVGYYPESRFVHVDTGKVRYW